MSSKILNNKSNSTSNFSSDSKFSIGVETNSTSNVTNSTGDLAVQQNVAAKNASYEIEGIMKDASVNENEKLIIAEFVHLLDKSKQLFNGLRDLPQYGYKTNQWQVYFGRTFDVYTKLWKFQQQYRTILDTRYNLKRWQIGEIASKIGQLYYHYYLRTSESNYLNESYSFYQAIQTRAYYSKVNKEEKPDLMVKKLRYLARFIVVCLLLKKTKEVKDLIRELSKQIDEYVKIYDPDDQLEWQLVRNEINDFIEADNTLQVNNANDVSINNRLDASSLPPIVAERHSSLVPLNLSEIIIIGNCQNQIKFSELSIDMFRMLQTVEREPSLDKSSEKTPGTTLYLHNNEKTDGNYVPIQRENPHKYLLYKPSFSQSLTYISAAFKDLPPHGVLMIYISADACEPTGKVNNDGPYDHGGLHTNNKRELSNQAIAVDNKIENIIRKSSNFKESHCIYPGDLYAFTRKPLFLIIDSPGSFAFQNFPLLFGQPFAAFLSPTNLPKIFQETKQKGSLFTLFLTNPLLGFCAVCSINNITTTDIYNKAQTSIDQIFIEIARSIARSKQIDFIYTQFYSDEFLRSYILRFVFCYATLRLHRGFKGTEYYPTSQPAISNDVLESVKTHKLILDLTLLLNMRQLFMDTIEVYS